MVETSIRLPDDLAEKIDERSEKEGGISRSEWIRRACRRELDHDPVEERLAALERRVNDLEQDQPQSLIERTKDRFSLAINAD